MPEESRTSPGEQPAGKPAPSFSELGKRIRSRTTDLLAIAIVVIGGFAVGGQVSRWWGADESGGSDPAQTAAGGGTAPFADGEPVLLDFGCCGNSLERSPFEGDRKAAGRQLLARCRKYAESAVAPTTPPTAEEKKLLDKLAGATPVQITDAGTRLYRFDGPVTLASATREARGDGDANPARRVVCWGMAFPAAENRWTLYVFGPAVGSGNTDGVVALPLPAEARPVLSLRTADGTAWRSFRTGGSVDSIRVFYQRWFESDGWKLRRQSGAWTAVFEKETGKTKLRAEVQTSGDGNGEVTGVVIVHRVRP